MRQFFTYLLLIVLGLVFLSGCQAQKASIRGLQGEIAYKVTLPDGFDPTTDQCPMVILMHGIFSSKDYIPMPQLARGLAEAGIASIRFDFGGHGKSEGTRRNTSAVGDCISWGANTSSPRSSSTSMALRLIITALCSSSTAIATASCRCGAASDTLRPTALMPP